MKKVIKIFLIILIASFFPYTAKAQFNLPTLKDVKSTLLLTPSPTTPLPESSITVTADLRGLNNNGSNYTWFLNGVRQVNSSGLNKNVFTLVTGKIGTMYRVNVSAATPSGENLSETINLTVSDVDLTWTSNSKGPVFYRAKLLPTQNSIVTISALPFIYKPGTKNQISSESLIYNWIIDDKLDSLKSGINRQSYVFRNNDSLGNKIIRLEIKTQDNAVSLIKETAVPVVRPQTLLYFSDSSTNRPYGIALKNVIAKTANFNFVAEAYFFTVPIKNLTLLWFINNTEVKGLDEKPWLANLNLSDHSFGQLSTQIKVTAQNPDNELETSQSIVNLEIK